MIIVLSNQKINISFPQDKHFKTVLYVNFIAKPIFALTDARREVICTKIIIQNFHKNNK